MSFETTDILVKSKFKREANDDFLVSNIDELLTEDKLRALIKDHKILQYPRLKTLEDYYLNRNTDILLGKRRLDDEKADHRIVHNYAKYVSRFIVGYLTGNPITITHDDEKTNDKIIELNDLNDADATNSDLALNLSIYGRAYEIIYRDSEDNDVFKLLDPKSTFVVYDESLDKNALAGIRYYTKDDVDKIPTDFVEVYTATDIHYIKIKSGQFETFETVNHFYNDVPIIEYANDQFKQGDFENILSLIDAYDASESDTANYMTDLNDAMLAIIGDSDLTGEDAQKFKDANMVHIVPSLNPNGGEGKADIKYIYKQYDVSGTEAYKSRLERDIHKFTNTPNLNDENFSGVQSGEAMKYKLFGLEQMRAIKERLFKKGLMKRYKLLFNNINIENLTQHSYKEITIKFTPNLPKSMMESIDAFNALNGGVSEATRMSLLDFIDDPNEELEKIKKEQKEEKQQVDAHSYQDAFNNDKKVVDNNGRTV